MAYYGQPQMQQQTNNNIVVVTQQAGPVKLLNIHTYIHTYTHTYIYIYIYPISCKCFLSSIDSSGSTEREALSSSSLHYYLFLLAMDLCLAPYVLHIWMLDEK